MFVWTAVRFAVTLIGSLFAFYLGAVLLHAAGYLGDQELQQVRWLYNRLLSPITSLSVTTQKTVLVLAVALGVQAFALSYLFGRWSYRPVKRFDRPARQARVEATIEVSGASPPSHVLRMYTGSSGHRE